MTNSETIYSFCPFAWRLGMISYLLISRCPRKIRILNQKITASTYPQSRDVLNKDGWNHTALSLKTKAAEVCLRSKSKKPNEIYNAGTIGSNQEATNEKEHFELSYIWNSAHGYGKHGCIFLLTKSIDSPNLMTQRSLLRLTSP